MVFVKNGSIIYINTAKIIQRTYWVVRVREVMVCSEQFAKRRKFR